MFQKLSNLQFGLIVTFNRKLKKVSLVLLPAPNFWHQAENLV